MQKFKELGLSAEIVRALTDMGFEEPSEIQAKAIPQLLKEDCDFLGLAQTGTGKTAAFGLPLLDKIIVEEIQTQAIVIAPTRELAIQIKTELDKFSKYKNGITIDAVYGGASIENQIRSIKRRNPHIIVGTAGRVIDLLKRKVIRLESIDCVVLDEADEMLNMGFKDDIDEILAYTPQQKSVWLFSATMPREIRSIVTTYMENPFEVKIDPSNIVNRNIAHQFLMVSRNNKLKALKRYIESEPDLYGVIFCRTKSDTGFVAENLASYGYDVEALNGDLSQTQRESVMKRFRSKGLRLIAATDVAARGIDVNNLTHVIHYSLPDDFAFYTHRSGRTARAGNKGISITIASSEDGRKIKMLQRELKIDFEQVEVPSAKNVQKTRLKSYFDSLLTVNTDAVSDELVVEYDQYLQSVDRDGLIKLLLAQQVNTFSLDDVDFSLKEAKQDRKVGAKSGSDDRYFINIGQIDNLTKRDLVELLASMANVSKDAFGDVVLQRNHSFLDIEKEAASKVLSLDGKEINGREIRINRDAQGGGGSKSDRRSSDRKGGSRSSYGRGGNGSGRSRDRDRGDRKPASGGGRRR